MFQGQTSAKALTRLHLPMMFSVKGLTSPCYKIVFLKLLAIVLTSQPVVKSATIPVALKRQCQDHATDCQQTTPNHSDKLNSSQLVITEGDHSETTHSVEAHIMLVVPPPPLTGYRCSRHRSIRLLTCEHRNGTKPTDLPEFSIPVHVSSTECANWIKHGRLQLADNSSHPVVLNQSLRHHFVRIGMTTHDVTSDWCTNLPDSHHDRPNNHKILLVGEEVLIEEILLEVNGLKLVELSSNISLPYLCKEMNSCQISTVAYRINHPEPYCPFQFITSVNTTFIWTNETGHDQFTFTSDQLRMPLITNGSEPVPMACRWDFSEIFHTQIPQIKVMLAKEDKSLNLEMTQRQTTELSPRQQRALLPSQWFRLEIPFHVLSVVLREKNLTPIPELLPRQETTTTSGPFSRQKFISKFKCSHLSEIGLFIACTD